MILQQLSSNVARGLLLGVMGNLLLNSSMCAQENEVKNSTTDHVQTIPTNKIRIVLVGDSTVTDHAGWGKGFQNCIVDGIQCTNLSSGGESSRSFIAEGLWKKCLELKPDYVLIQFGHNDLPGHDANHVTDAKTTYRQFIIQFVDDAQAAGAKPVLITSLSQREWGEDGKIHSSLQSYVDVIKRVSIEKHVPLIDLHTRSIELYEKLGKQGCVDIAPTKSDGVDISHLSSKGSDIIGPIVAEEFKKSVPDLAQYFK